MKTLDFRLVSIDEAASFYGVSVLTMRRWDKSGKLKSTLRTLGNHSIVESRSNHDQVCVSVSERRKQTDHYRC